MATATLTRRRVLTAAAVGMGVAAGAGGSALGVQAIRGSSRPSARGPLRVDRATLSYFNEVALHEEGNTTPSRLRKWQTNPRIRVNLNPTWADRDFLTSLIAEINSLQNGIVLSQVESGENVDLYFVSTNQFTDCDPHAQNGYAAYFVRYDNTRDPYVIDGANVMIASDIAQDARLAAMRQDITQMLGLPNDSDTYPDSAFRMDWPLPTEFSAIDRQLIRLLYDPRLKPGMTFDDVMNVVDMIG